MPDYEIKEWNEDNFDLNCNVYCKQAYDKKSTLLPLIMRDCGFCIIRAVFIWTQI